MRIAAIDLGSNSFHLVVVDAHPDGSFDTLVREKEVLRLGDVVASTGRIGPEHTERAVDAMRRMASVIRNVGADEVVACATSALREADDSAAVCDAIYDETGITVDVISGLREAQLIFGAVRRSITISKPPAVCLDLGGGSLEISVGDATGLQWSTSVHLGVGRLNTTFVEHDPPTSGELRRLKEHVTEVLTPVVERVSAFAPRMMVGTSGTLCALATAAAARRDGVVPASINQLTVSRRDLSELHDRLVASTGDERAKLPGLDPRRADQIPAGSTVLLTAMKMLDLSELTVGEWALREGMLLDAIDRHEVADWSDDIEAVRRSSVLALARRCNYDEVHASAVARLATDLFDQLAPLHRLPPSSRQLLEYAAILHDIGEHVSVDDHNKHTAYLIQHGRLKGFEPQDIDVLAALGRYHRRGGPGSSFEPWRRLDRTTKDEASVLLAILRLADGLDRSHLGSVDAIHVDIDDERVRVLVAATADADLAVWGARRKRELFEEALGRRLELVAADHPSVRAHVLRDAAS